MLIRKEKIIALLNKNETNIIIITLIKKIKKFIETKCKLDLKKSEISKMLIKITRGLLKISIFTIINNIKPFRILKKK